MTPIAPASEVAVLVVSCDAYRDLWHPFFQCFFKYWPNCPYPVFLGTNELSYQDVRVKTIRVGPDRDYSTNLINILNCIEQEWIILWVEDRFLSAPVDTARLSDLIRTAQVSKAGYLKLISDYPLAYVSDASHLIGEIPKGVRYRISLTVSLWQKSILIKLLLPGETAWDIERHGSLRSTRIEDKFLCISSAIKHNPPIANVHGVIKGNWIRHAKKFLKQEGLDEYISPRPVQNIWSYLYYKAYFLRLDMYTTMRCHWRI